MYLNLPLCVVTLASHFEPHDGAAQTMPTQIKGRHLSRLRQYRGRAMSSLLNYALSPGPNWLSGLCVLPTFCLPKPLIWAPDFCGYACKNGDGGSRPVVRGVFHPLSPTGSISSTREGGIVSSRLGLVQPH